MLNSNMIDRTGESHHRYGYCHCGCGEKTEIAPQDDDRYGNKKGEPYRYVKQHHRRLPLEERFWSKVDATGDGCWKWTAYKNKKGYGIIGIGGDTEMAHRISYKLNVGDIPRDMLVLHSCDNPSCVRPSHLWLGTNEDNMADMAKKGRSTKGRPRSK